MTAIIRDRPAPKPRIAVLLSGRGTNLDALAARCDSGDLDAEIVLVAADREQAYGLEVARQYALETAVFSYKGLGRDRAERQLARTLLEYGVSWIVLAGFMKVLSPQFVLEFEKHIVNIHPSLLPAFRGADAIEQAHRYGVKVTGVTVHLVDERVDHGPILRQVAVPVHDSDSLESLEERIHGVEHQIYWRTLRELFAGGFVPHGRRYLKGDRTDGTAADNP